MHQFAFMLFYHFLEITENDYGRRIEAVDESNLYPLLKSQLGVYHGCFNEW
jgi:hypothetical protein